jgi:hypothetical protein
MATKKINLKFNPIHWILVFMLLLQLACENEISNPVVSNNQSMALNKTSTYSYESIKPELTRLLLYLKTHPALLTPASIAKAADRFVTFPELGLKDQFPDEFLLNNGNTFKVYVELFNGSVGNATNIEATEVYLALDVDRYPAEAAFSEANQSIQFKAHVAATTYNQKKGLYQDENSQVWLTLNSKTQKVNYLLFFVGGEDYPPEFEGLPIGETLRTTPADASLIQAPQTTLYWWLISLKLKAKKDTSNEEFELYWCNGFGTGYVFQANTNHRFDGGSHGDFSGYSRSYPDVNTYGTYTPSHPIAIDNYWDNFQLAAIEDDDTAGSHKNSHHGGGKHNQ